MRSLGAVVASILLVTGAAACGNDGSTTTAGSRGSTESVPGGTDQKSTKPGSEGEHGEDELAQSSGSDSEGSASPDPSASGTSTEDEIHDSRSVSEPSPVQAVPLRVSGGGSAQFREADGDNSIQEFGEEGDESELQEVAEVVHSFFEARSNEDWASACTYLAKPLTGMLEEFSENELGLKSCASSLEAFTRPLPAAVRRELTVVDAVSLRRDGERSFLIYLDAGKTALAIPLKKEDGTWGVALLAGTPVG